MGTALPDAELPDLDGNRVALREFAAHGAVLVIFSANHCPYVKWVEREIAAIAAENPDLHVVAICSNDAVEYPEDDVAGLRDQKTRAGWNFPYLIDTEQDVAREFGAVCTPDFFLFNQERKLVYRGQLDDSRPGNNKKVTGVDLRNALLAVLQDKPVTQDQRPSMGCNIKWKAGNEPADFR